MSIARGRPPRAPRPAAATVTVGAAGFLSAAPNLVEDESSPLSTGAAASPTVLSRLGDSTAATLRELSEGRILGLCTLLPLGWGLLLIVIFIVITKVR
jgi:hypothetical protein